MTGRELVGVFASLKFRLLRNGLRSPSQAVILVMASLLAVVVSLLGLAVFAAARSLDPDAQRKIAVGGFGLVWTAWTFAPLLAGGVDDSIDPTRLALLPLTRRQRMVGQTVGGLIGIGSIGCLVALIGVPIGYAPLGMGAVLVVCATVVLATLSFACSRALSVVLTRAQSSRVGRDLVGGLAAILGLSLWFGLQTLGATLQSDVAARALDVMRWLPPGWLGHAVFSMSQPAPGLAATVLAAGEILGGAAVAAGGLAWWIIGTERLLTEPSGLQGPVRSRGGAPLFGRLLAPLPRNAQGAALAKELRGLVRVPAQRTRLVGLAALAVVIPLIDRVADAELGPVAVFMPLMLSTTFNQFGLDGRALWIEFVTAVPVRVLVFARSVTAVTELGAYAIAAELAARVIGGASSTGSFLPFVPAVIFVVVGVGAVASQLAPIPLPESANPFVNRNANAGAGCLAGAVVGGAVLLSAAAAGPVLVASVVTADASGAVRVAAVCGSVAYGLAGWGLGVYAAGRRLGGREPELLAKVATRVGE